jgi:hypothetical protein
MAVSNATPPTGRRTFPSLPNKTPSLAKGIPNYFSNSEPALGHIFPWLYRRKKEQQFTLIIDEDVSLSDED